MDQFGWAAPGRIAAAEPEECRCNEKTGEEDDHQRGQHLAGGNTARPSSSSTACSHGS